MVTKEKNCTTVIFKTCIKGHYWEWKDNSWNWEKIFANHIWYVIHMHNKELQRNKTQLKKDSCRHFNRRCTWKMLDITSHQGNANQNHSEVPLHTPTGKAAAECGARNLKPCARLVCMTRCSCWGKVLWFLKKVNTETLMTQQPHFWGYTSK